MKLHIITYHISTDATSGDMSALRRVTTQQSLLHRFTQRVLHFNLHTCKAS